ncbi:hypothetical protein L207DRAFT_509657 [Hyaloscypha variabilis F]|uniref:Metallothionein n=1 Tax=Hyaloscypha variabilis (strain UAMH 11265 / GT02V1 / F) TaxID=1149755 RepID=A0A2J6RX61_HYAVF|nr:hypothetical protein L207DRAFT_509657 [Hyaloscypha variabilis F]
MPIVVEQQIQAPEPMTANTSAITSQQPKPAPAMTTGDEVGLRGGESASCNCCDCGCSESCC